MFQWLVSAVLRAGFPAVLALLVSFGVAAAAEPQVEDVPEQPGFVPTPSHDDTRTGDSIADQSGANMPPNDPMSASTPGVRVECTVLLMRASAWFWRSMSTPASR